MKRIPHVEVRPWRGAPCLHVDGDPHSGLAFWHCPGERGRGEWRLFARAGVHLFQLGMPLWGESAAAPDPTAAWDRTLEATLAADPAARIWIRLALEPPAWWCESHPDEVQVHHDERNGERFVHRVAFASGVWRRETAERLRRFVAYMEERWGERVWCYQLCAGDCGEWAYSWKPVLSGYAPAQIAAWREWLRERYTNDEAALRGAWVAAEATFATATPPAWNERIRTVDWPPASHLVDAASERRLVDWLTFHGRAQAEALAELAAATRRAMDTLDRRKLVAAFHGYHIWPYGSAYGVCNTGFSDLTPVLHSPDIDALCTPLAYIHRNPGGLYSHHNLAASIHLQDKLFYAEDDTFTHRAKWTPWRYCCRSAAETMDILRRNLAGALSEGGSLWWMDHDSDGWYLDPELEAGVERMRRIADAALSYDRSPCAEVAFLTNEESFHILRQDPALLDQLWPKQQSELMRLGAPVDFVRVQDLDAAARRGDVARWKFIVVAGCLWLDPDARDRLRRHLLGGGRHVLFLHGQGMCDGDRLDPAFTAELAGISLKNYPHGGPCRAETLLDGVHLSWGTDKEVAPILYAEDDAAETLGWLERQYYPVLVRKAHPGWTALWSGVPGLPWNLLGRLAEAAGVHRYLTDGSQVLANGGLLAVHAAGDGRRALRLPRPRRAITAPDGPDLGVVDEIPLRLRRGETRIWHLAEAADKTDLTARLDGYLRRLARKDWGAPSGFGGGTCFQAIPALELERRGEPHGNFRWEWIDYSLDLLRRRKDCQDFVMVGLVRILYRYPDSRLLAPERRAEIEHALLAAKYAAQDPGEDACCWHTENHQVQYAAAELLVGQLFPDRVFSNTGKIGRWHRERAREQLDRWLDWRARFSFSEWNSSCYYDEDGAALLNLAEYAEDPDLRRRSREVFEQMLFHVAVNSWRGMTGASQGRAYFEQQILPAETPMATLAQVCWGDGEPPDRLRRTAVSLAAGDVRVPSTILAAGRAVDEPMENRERHSLDAEEAALYAVYPDRLRDLPFFQGAGQAAHHLVAETHYAALAGEEKWPGFFVGRDYYARCREQGETFDTWALPHALGHADLYTYRTPDYMLGCAQAYHPGAPGYQQFIWSATLGPRTVVFTTNPAPSDIPYGRPGPWVGNGVLPKVVQHRNVLIALHRVRPCPIYDQPPWYREDRVHAWFPRAAFDEVVERDGWCFGRLADAYVALRPDKPAKWLPPNPELAAKVGGEEAYEWNVDAVDVAWICELGARRTHGTFEGFVERVAGARVEGNVDHLVYQSPSLGRIETGWALDFSVAGETIAIRDYPLFDNPFRFAAFGAKTS